MTNTHRKAPLTRDAASTLAANFRAAEAKAGRALSHSQALARVAAFAGYANVHELTAQYAAAEPPVAAREDATAKYLAWNGEHGQGTHALLFALTHQTNPEAGLYNLITDLITERRLGAPGAQWTPQGSWTLRVGPDVPDGIEMIDDSRALPDETRSILGAAIEEFARKAGVPVVDVKLDRSWTIEDIKGMPLPKVGSNDAAFSPPDFLSAPYCPGHISFDLADWLAWARSSTLHPAVIAYIEANPDRIGLETVPTPAMWEATSRALTSCQEKGLTHSLARFLLQVVNLPHQDVAGVLALRSTLETQRAVIMYDEAYLAMKTPEGRAVIETLARDIHANSITTGPVPPSKGRLPATWGDLQVWVAGTFYYRDDRKARYALSQHIDARLSELRGYLPEIVGDEEGHRALLDLLKSFPDLPEGFLEEVTKRRLNEINEVLNTTLFDQLQHLVPEDDEG